MATSELKFWKPRKLETLRLIEPEDYLKVEPFDFPNGRAEWVKSDHIGEQKIPK